ncbi:unnamed protein product [Polarella glacialis]|uniref:Uncharacterized protein n=1 Tax=Polarella glacialis TaxID=89957 RepID=A0A813E9X3_POLGL|nr:unnamed protein product [Polarella glacialis]
MWKARTCARQSFFEILSASCPKSAFELRHGLPPSHQNQQPTPKSIAARATQALALSNLHVTAHPLREQSWYTMSNNNNNNNNNNSSSNNNKLDALASDLSCD